MNFAFYDPATGRILQVSSRTVSEDAPIADKRPWIEVDAHAASSDATRLGLTKKVSGGVLVDRDPSDLSVHEANLLERLNRQPPLETIRESEA